MKKNSLRMSALLARRKACYCCTCTYDEDDAMIEWDSACRNHGAHGARACAKHNLKAENCDCGCGYRTSEQ